MKTVNIDKHLNLSALLQILPGSVYWEDINGVYLGCNESMAHMAGFHSPREMIGKTDYDMPWHDQAGILCNLDKEVIKSDKNKQ